MLAILVARPGVVTANDLLVEAMWPDGPPSGDGLRALRTAASRLRQAVGPASVESVAPGYRLAMGSDEVDAWAFDAALTRDDALPPAEELSHLDAALALWRGRAFEEFAEEAWAVGPAVHLDELRTAAGERRLELLASTGSYPDAVAEALRFVREHPYRDRPRLVLLRSLAATGRQAAALRAYQDYREEMADAGLDPGEEVQALERQLVAGSSTAGADPGATEPANTDQASSTTATSPRSTGSTTTLTVLFTDLVGSTALLSRVGQVRADELRREHFALMRGTIESCGGREVKNLGDGLMVVFERAADGLACAIAMQRAQASWPAGGTPTSTMVSVRPWPGGHTTVISATMPATRWGGPPCTSGLAPPAAAAAARYSAGSTPMGMAHSST